MDSSKPVQPIGDALKRALESIPTSQRFDSDVDAAVKAELDREKQRRFEEIWASFGEPLLRRHKEYADGIINDMGQWGEALHKAIDVCKEGDSVTITGPRGTGKTEIAVIVARGFCERGKRPVYLTAWDLFARFKASYRDGGRPEIEIMEDLGRVPLLILDEVHERGETAWEDRTLVRLIDYRYGAKLPTILLANQTPEELAESLGPSICDRLREAGTVIEATWSSFRGKGGGE